MPSRHPWILLGLLLAAGCAGPQRAWQPAWPATDLDAADAVGRTALHLAAAGGVLDVDARSVTRPDQTEAPGVRRATVKTLLAAGASPAVEDRFGWAPLHWAAAAGRVEALRQLLAAGADSRQAAWSRPRRPYQVAYQFKAHLVCRPEGYSQACGRAGMEGCPRWGWTPLHAAAQFCQPAAARVLIELSPHQLADTPPSCPHPLHPAAEEGCKELVVEILKAGAPIDPIGPYGWTPLRGAAENGHAEVMDLLIAAGAQVDAKDHEGDTPLLRAAEHGHPDAIRRLVAAGASLTARNRDGDTPLHVAVSEQQAECVEALLDAGSDPEQRDGRGRTALQHAFDPDLVELLLDRGAKPRAKGPGGATALHLAVPSAGSPSHALWGLPWEETPCDRAAERIDALLDAGAEVNARDESGRTPLHYAAARGSCDAALEELAEGGADLRARDDEGRSPLHTAAQSGQRDPVRWLLARGADREARDKCGHTPMDLAKAAGKSLVIDLMRR